MEKYRIVADSSSDVFDMADVSYACAPLKIITANDEFVDDATLDVEHMVDSLAHYKGRSSSSCPNPGDWLDAFGDAENVFCITITATLSGSYNSAVAAKELYEEQYPGRNVFVLNSLTTGPEMKLIMERVREGILSGMEFEDICDDAMNYSLRTGLIFVLESMKNLANNGRVSPIAAKAAGVLGIRAIGMASDRGDLEMLSKARGERKTLESIVSHMKKLGWSGGRVRISHCLNEVLAAKLRELLRAEFSKLEVEIYRCRGLCSFYAERGGLLIGFEK